MGIVISSNLVELEDLLLGWSERFVIDKEISKGGYEEGRGIFEQLSFKGKSYKTPEDYLQTSTQDFLKGGSFTSGISKDLDTLKRIILRVYFVKAFGGEVKMTDEEISLMVDVLKYKSKVLCGDN